ncbi:hypothetical protein GF342_05900 [Candidatus Woesearchaeota archaeon]|nr:hypothetical protein [Candidatus Woesearchaeota archaeon]
MKAFISQFWNGELAHIKIGNEYYKKNDALTTLTRDISKTPVSQGQYLGQQRKGLFYPSSYLLQFLAKKTTKKLIVTDKAAWLFVCGKDIRRRSVIEQYTPDDGDYVLILNTKKETLGYARITVKNKAIVRITRLFDIGDYLRRE